VCAGRAFSGLSSKHLQAAGADVRVDYDDSPQRGMRALYTCHRCADVRWQNDRALYDHCGAVSERLEVAMSCHVTV